MSKRTDNPGERFYIVLSIQAASPRAAADWGRSLITGSLWPAGYKGIAGYVGTVPEHDPPLDPDEIERALQRASLAKKKGIAV